MSNSINMISKEEKDTIDKLINTFEENHILIEENKRLKEELRAVKDFCGYDGNMNLEEMVEYKDECEEIEKNLRDGDSSFDEQTKNGERLVDLAVEMGECEYELVDIGDRIKTNCDIELRKRFMEAFNKMRESVDGDKLEDFLEDMEEYFCLIKRIHKIDKQIADIRQEDE